MILIVFLWLDIVALRVYQAHSIDYYAYFVHKILFIWFFNIIFLYRL